MVDISSGELFRSEEKRLRWELFNEHKRLAWGNIQSSTDSYDQGLLTLSSGGLGLSIAFIKDIVPIEHAVWLMCLYVSWAAFVGCILTTVVSFQVSVAAQNEHIQECKEYYIEEKEGSGDRQGPYKTAVKWCTGIAGFFFVVALFCTVVFAVTNVRRMSTMAQDRDGRSFVKDGRAPVSLTPVPKNSGEERGRPAADLTPLPKPSTTEASAPSGQAPGSQQPAQVTGKE